jgi:carbon storage regulator
VLILGRDIGERIRIGDDVELVVVRVSGGRVVLGVEAPPEVRIRRERTVREGGEREEAGGEPRARPFRKRRADGRRRVVIDE